MPANPNRPSTDTSLPPMYDPAEILDAVRKIRPELPQLLDADLAQSVDRQLAELLNQTDLTSQAKGDRLLAILDSYPPTQARLDEILNSAIGKGISFQSLAGSAAPIAALRYVCPICNDFPIDLEDIRDIPLCKTHLVPFVPVRNK